MSASSCGSIKGWLNESVAICSGPTYREQNRAVPVSVVLIWIGLYEFIRQKLSIGKSVLIICSKDREVEKQTLQICILSVELHDMVIKVFFAIILTDICRL